MHSRDVTRHWQGRTIAPSTNRYPTRWLKVDRETGVVLGTFSGRERPTGSWDESRVVIASAKVGK